MIVMVIFFIIIGIAGFLLMLRLSLKSRSMPVQGANEEFNFIISLISKAANIQKLDRAKNQINAFMYRYRHQISVRDLSWYEDRMHTALRLKLVEFGGPQSLRKEKFFSGKRHSVNSKLSGEQRKDRRPENKHENDRDRNTKRDVDNSGDLPHVPIEVEKNHRNKN